MTTCKKKTLKHNMSQDYLSRVDFDEQAEIFHGEIINIRDVLTFQGKSVSELWQAFKDSVEDYPEFCVECGEEPDKPFNSTIKFLRFAKRINK